MIRKRVVSIGTLLIFFAIALIAIRTGTASDALQAEFLACFNERAQRSTEECVEKNVSSWMERFGFESVVEQLDRYDRAAGDTATCHAVGHIVGGELYRQQNDLGAFSHCTDACLSSCVHGVQMAYAADNGFQELVRETVENDLCDRWRGDTVQYKLCFHGLGHVFLTALDYDYTEAALLCHRLSERENPADTGSLMCLGGLFMELFLGSEVHAGKGIPRKEGDPLFPCTDERLSEIDKHQCMVHINFSLKDQPSYWEGGSMERCRQAPPELQDSCSFGAGYVGMLYNAKAPERVHAICRSATNSVLRNACLEGAVSYLVFADRSSAEAEEFCSPLSLSEKLACATTFE